MTTTNPITVYPGELPAISTPGGVFLHSSSTSQVIQALIGASNSGRLDVRGAMALNADVAKYDLITFTDQSVLELSNLNVPYIALAAKQLLLDIRNPGFQAVISRPIGALETAILAGLAGNDGAKGVSGANGANGGGDGAPGQDGGFGQGGAAGKTQSIPAIYLFVQDLIFGSGATPNKQYFLFNFPGFTGGRGGKGGDGGSGGRGGDGQNGSPGAIGCRQGAGTGGHGGNAGWGGPGGQGGNAGNGADLFLFAPKPGVFDYTTLNVEAGSVGLPGSNGQTGVPGKGGSGGAAVGWCTGNGMHGVDGGVSAFPPPWNIVPPFPGQPGSRGTATVTARDNADLF